MAIRFLLLVVLALPARCWEVSDYVQKSECQFQYLRIPERLELNASCNALGQASILPAQGDGALRLSESGACLTRLPDNLCEFPGIIDLSLTSSGISEIPRLACLPNLARLDLRHNNISRLRAGTFDGLEHLAILDLRHNAIQTIDVGVFTSSLASLVFVNLDYNRLAAAEAWPMLLGHEFCYFSLSHNNISKFTNRERWFLDKTVGSSDGMVDFSYNSFSEWITEDLKQYGFTTLPSLSRLMQWGFDFRGNPWHCDCKFYEFLNLTKGNFVEVFFRNYMLVTCASPVHLAGRLIYDLPLPQLVCNVTEACPAGCFCQDQPRNARMLVTCRGAGLRALPDSLPPGQLRLDLRDNGIARLTPAPYLARVRELRLSHNGLLEVSPEAVEMLEGVQLLDLAHNALRSLPPQVQRFRPRVLRLEQNALRCDCDSSWLGSWLRNLRATYGRSLGNLVCRLKDGTTVNAIDVSVKSLGCEKRRGLMVLEVLLGVAMLVLVVSAVLAMLFRYELLVWLQTRRGCPGPGWGAGPDRGEGVGAEEPFYDWFLSVESEDDSDRLWAGQELRPALESTKGLRLYIPFIHHTIGGVAADETLAAILQSRGAVVLLSSSYASSPAKSSEFTHIYKVMASRGQGPIRVIKHSDVKASSVANGYLRAIVRLKMYIDFQDEKLLTKVVQK